MSLTVVDAIAKAVKSSALEETWYAKLYYGDESSFTGICERDLRISTQQYYGIVQEWGDIVQQIDIVNSNSSISDTTIICSNTFKTGLLSDVIYGDTNKYINRKVEIFTYINGTSLQLYTGRLVKAPSTLDTITLHIEGYVPWKNITIPQTKTTTDHILEPVAYGDFETDTIANHYSGKAYYPMPYLKRRNNVLHFMACKNTASDADPHFYDSNIDKFIPISSASTATASNDGVNTSTVPIDFERILRLRPTADNSDDFTNSDRAYDETSTGAGDTTTLAEETDTAQVGEQSITKNLKLDEIEEPIGKINTLTTYVDYKIVVTSVTETGATYVALTNDIYSTDTEIDSSNSVGTIDSTDSYSIITFYETNNYKLPTEWQIVANWEADAGDHIAATLSIKDCYLTATIDLDWENEPDNSETFIKDLKLMYCGGDGLAQSYTGGSGTAKLPHEILRDLLARFTDFDFADVNWSNWTGMDEIRSGWGCRWWSLKPVDLGKILKQIQYEGCFILKIKHDNSGANLIWVRNSYSTSAATSLTNEVLDDSEVEVTVDDASEFEIGGVIKIDNESMKIEDLDTDIDALLVIRGWRNTTATTHTDNTQVYFDDADFNFDKNDYEDLEIDITDVNQLVTKTEYNYEKHPAKNTYIQNTTYTNSTARTDWLVGTNENFLEKNLDFIAADKVNTGSGPNDCVALYYDNIVANPKILVKFKLKNMKHIAIEEGDIFKINDTDVDPYGKTWSDLYFITEKINRLPGDIRVHGRLVYEAP